MECFIKFPISILTSKLLIWVTYNEVWPRGLSPYREGSGAGHTMNCTPPQEPRHWMPPSERRDPAGAKSGRGTFGESCEVEMWRGRHLVCQATDKVLLIATYHTESHSAYPLCGEIEWTYEAECEWELTWRALGSLGSMNE